MSAELSSLLDLSANDCLVFTNRDFNSHAFIFDHLVHTSAKKGSNLLLILLSNSWSHYRSIAAKIGINLAALKDKQLIRVIDVLAEDEEFDYKRFTADLDKHLSQLCANSVVLVDDISLLFTLGVDFLSVYKLVHKLRVHCLHNDILVAIGTHYPREEDDEEVNRFVVSIVHISDILCQTDKTSSGYSPLVSGCLHITTRRDNITKQFNYKISDRSVKLMTIGSQLF
jgi:hypothetical protein